MIIECVVNISEGRDERLLAELKAAAGSTLLDTHTDPDFHRSVFTLAGEADAVINAARALAESSVARLELTGHRGAHPRMGVLDVVPFVPYDPAKLPPADLEGVVAIRNDFARWLGAELGVPAFIYGPIPGAHERTLPQVRRHAFDSLAPDFGPNRPHPTAGASAVGARSVLIAYNIWVSSLAVANHVAPAMRRPGVRALAILVGDRAAVSCNLIDPATIGPAQVLDQVAGLAATHGGAVEGAELVGLIPDAILKRIPRRRWSELGLSASATLEARLAT